MAFYNSDLGTCGFFLFHLYGNFDLWAGQFNDFDLKIIFNKPLTPMSYWTALGFLMSETIARTCQSEDRCQKVDHICLKVCLFITP